MGGAGHVDPAAAEPGAARALVRLTVVGGPVSAVLAGDPQNLEDFWARLRREGLAPAGAGAVFLEHAFWP